MQSRLRTCHTLFNGVHKPATTRTLYICFQGWYLLIAFGCSNNQVQIYREFTTGSIYLYSRRSVSMLEFSVFSLFFSDDTSSFSLRFAAVKFATVELNLKKI